jgi:plasmid stability protein
MPMIQIRNVPDHLHRELKARAALNGMTLSDYLLGELRSLAARPTMREWLAEAKTLERVEGKESPAEAIAAERERRPV